MDDFLADLDLCFAKLFAGLRALPIVMKLTHANRQPVAKLSDSPGKLQRDDDTLLAYLRQVLKVDS